MADHVPGDPALIWASGADAPGTHVLLIGIGEYDHLVNGARENLSIAEGMTQLDAPPLSVGMLADWFLGGNFVNEERPLASLAMVVSAAEPFDYPHPRRTTVGPVPNGDVASVLAAIGEWLARASTHRENQIIFYFCGHGVLSGTQTLLCRDFGAGADPFDGALSFDNFHAAMANKVPEYQIFLADACRTSDPIVDLVTNNRGAGRRAVGPSSLKERGGMPARQSIHLATSDLSRSFGRVKGPSLYAEALLRALAGGGAQRELGMWVGTDGLQNALGAYTARLARSKGVEQEPDRIKSGRFRIHKPAKVQVPVYLSCDPAEAFASKFKLTTQRDGLDCCVDEHDPGVHPDRREFELLLETDKYRFVAAFGDDSPFVGGEDRVVVHPPEVPVVLPIARRPL